jgi:hypothetical protein
MNEPAIRGGTFLLAAEDLLALIDRGKVSREEIEVALRREDFELLHSKPAAAAWVPIESFARIIDLLLEHDGGGDVAYLRQRGIRAAERGFDSGMFAQLRHSAVIGELTEGGRRVFKELDGRMMTSISAAIFNFGSWSFRDTGECYEVEARDVGPMPDTTRHSIEGFLEVMSARTSLQHLKVTSERIAPDRILFTIAYPS